MGGIMSKTLKGMGAGLSAAGEIGLRGKVAFDVETHRAKIMALRDQRLEELRAGDLAKRENFLSAEGALDRQNRLDAAAIQKESHLEGIDRQLSAKDNKPVIIPKGSIAIGTDGSVLFENTATEDRTINVPEGTVVLDAQTRKIVFINPKQSDEGVSKKDKDTDQRVQMYRQFVDNYMGIGFMNKLNDTERPDFARLLTDGADQVRGGTHPEQAFRLSLKALDDFKARATARVSTPRSGSNHNVEEIRKKFGF